MYRLSTLGRIHLVKDGAPVAIARSKPLALLIFLATQPAGHRVRCDRILALFWPELDTAAARHSLRQALYFLRQAVGTGVIVRRGEEELGVAPNEVWCDARSFLEAVHRGDVAEANALYKGEFLPSYHVERASNELDEWIEQTRNHLRTSAIDAGWQLADHAAATGDLARAVEFARTSASRSPLDAIQQRRLMSFLTRLGDPGGALLTYEKFKEHLEGELELHPDGETERLAMSIRHAKPSPTTLRQRAELRDSNAGSATLGIPFPTPVVVNGIRQARTTFTRPLIFVAGLALAITAFAYSRRSTIRDAEAPTLVAVTSIREVGAGIPSGAPLPLADLLATSLARLRSLQVVSGTRLIEIEQALVQHGATPTSSEIAKRAGATHLLEGSIYRLGPDTLRLDLRQIELNTGAVTASFRVIARDAFGLIDSATAQIARATSDRVPMPGIAAVTTRSLQAYRFHEEGLRSYYDGDTKTARHLFQSAVSEDSLFAMAQWYLAQAEGALLLPSGRPQFQRALRLAGASTDRERLLITAHVRGSIFSDPGGLAVAETLAVRYPADPEAFRILGMSRSFTADYTGGIAALRHALAMDSIVAPIGGGAGCRVCETYSALALSYVGVDSLDQALRIAQEFTKKVPNAAASWGSLVGIALLAGNIEAARDAERKMESLSAAIDMYAGVPTVGPLYQERYNAADERLLSLAQLSEASRLGDVRWLLAISLRNQGRLSEAIALARHGTFPLPRLAHGVALNTDSLLLGLALLEHGDASTCVRYFTNARTKNTLDLMRTEWPGLAARELSWALGRLAMCRAAAGDTIGFVALADSLQTIGARSFYGRDRKLHHYVRGLLWSARKNDQRAIPEYEKALSSRTLGFTRINVELANAFLNTGRARDAVAVLQPALRGSIEASNLYVTRTELHELLARAWEATGGADSARVHYRAVANAWQNADSMFQSRLNVARQRSGIGLVVR